MAEITLSIAPHERQAFRDLYEAFKAGEQMHVPGSVQTLLQAAEVYEALEAIATPVGRNGQRGIPPEGGQVQLTQTQADYLREWTARGIFERRTIDARSALGVLVLLQRCVKDEAVPVPEAQEAA